MLKFSSKEQRAVNICVTQAGSAKTRDRAFAKALAAACIALAMVLLPFAGAFAWVDEAEASASSEGFYIEDYDVQMSVSEEGVYTIQETIKTNFTQYKHGIFREIPTSMTVRRADGSSGRAHAKVRNFKANTPWTSEISSGSGNGVQSCYNVRLGDPDELVYGKQKYVLSYDYVVDGDLLQDRDEFYFNIIGTGWPTRIEHATFTIEMPKEFDQNKVGFSIGRWGKSGHAYGEMGYNVDGTIITGEVLRTMEDYEGLSIRIELPETYFTTEPAGTGLLPLYLLPIIFAIFSFILWFREGRDIRPVETVEFEPPAGCNSLDAGVFDHFDVNNEDVLSLLIHLADKGYIEVVPEMEVDRPTRQNDFVFRKLRNYDGNNQCEREFMNGLFQGGSYADTESLEESFYLTIRKITAIENAIVQPKVVTRKGRSTIMTMMMIAYAVIALPALLMEDMMYYLVSLIPLAGIFFISHTVKLTGKTPARKVRSIVLAIIFGLLIIGIPVLFFMVPVLQRLTPLVGMAFAVDLIIIAVMMVFWNIVQRRTDFGVEMAGKIGGYKNFLLTVEKDRIERMVEEDPESFYHILPYAYALGISDAWIRKFEGITIPKPTWYHSRYDYWDGYMMGRLLSFNMMHNFTVAATSTPQMNISGGGGGGGFSGGGFGGGGGGSW